MLDPLFDKTCQPTLLIATNEVPINELGRVISGLTLLKGALFVPPSLLQISTVTCPLVEPTFKRAG